jgi:hypothetical protein
MSLRAGQMVVFSILLWRSSLVGLRQDADFAPLPDDPAPHDMCTLKIRFALLLSAGVGFPL